MKTFAISLAAAVILAATASSPVLAASDQQIVQPKSASNCLPNSVGCKRPQYRPRHPRCWTVAVRDRNGALRKRRVCDYS